MYFERSFNQKYRHAVFYGLPKIHKEKKNGYYRTRPVVSKCGTFVEIASKWVDFQLQQLIHLFPSHLKDSFHILRDLRRLQIDSNIRIFTADAVSMYTYIDTTHATRVISEWFQRQATKLPEKFPTHLVTYLLSIVMEHNVFKFGDLWFHQTSGTAMGTSVAPIYALLYYGIHENTTLLPRFQSKIVYYRRFIDDILVIWRLHPNQLNSKNAIISCFQDCFPFGKLQWKMEEPGFQTTFLDLNIRLSNGKIFTETHHKPLNLHLYIPPKSAHPPKVLFGLISGALRRFWLQNTSNERYRLNVSFLFEKLCQRGHNKTLLTTLFQQASRKYVRKYGNVITFVQEKKAKPDDKRTFFLHTQYHPRGLSRKWLHDAYQQSLSKLGFYERQIICLSRPKNLRDILIPSTLHSVQGKDPSVFFS